MGNDIKFAPDDINPNDDTVTRKITRLQDLGVLDKPPDEAGAFGTTSTIKTYPFEKTKKGGSGFGRLFAWIKKN